MIVTIDPSNGESIKEFLPMSIEEISHRMDQGHKSFLQWKNLGIKERSHAFSKMSQLLIEQKQSLAELMTKEMGKPISQSLAEVEKCALCCDYYVENAEKFLSEEIVDEGSPKSLICHEPLGVILGIMPWNFPFWQVFRFAIPTLLAGNAVILKHASNVTGCSLEIDRLFKEAGFLSGIFQSIVIEGHKMNKVIEMPLVKAISLTGSTPAGQSVAEVAGRHLKKCVLELGGNDPYLILSDADLDLAVEKCVSGRLLNAGQSCIAPKRLIVESSVIEAFKEKILNRLKTIECGDPMDLETMLGPMARRDLRVELDRQVNASVNEGAELLLGGEVPKGPGAFYPATLLAAVSPGVTAFSQELFGPVWSLIEAKDEAHGIQLANETSFGLGSAVFTQNLEKGEEIARKQLQSGASFVNDFVKSDPRLPFGGINQSGYGRELSSYGIHEFVNTKTVVVN